MKRSLPLFTFFFLVAAITQAPAQSSVVGQWGTTQPFPIISVHTCLMPDGKVIFWDYSGTTRIWDPATTAITTPTQPGRNTFCSGNSFFPNGKLFVPGGHIENNVGLPSASYYDPVANTWTSVPNMNAGRWYPSSTVLPNGDILVTSGDDNFAVNDLPQVYQLANNTWRSLTSARLGLPLYPRTFLAPNGRVFFATSTSRYLDTSGSGSWSSVANTIFPGRDNYGSACIDHLGRVFWFGGGDPPTASVEMIDLTSASPAWVSRTAMPQPRRQNNVTILPDGRMLVTGGSASAGFNTEDGPKAALVYDPAANSWATWATESDYRGYHSTAVLLPDGRVLSSGGDNHANGQVFSPPYLFNGARPTISSAPAAVNYGQTFFVGTPEGAGITRVTWTMLGALTHAQNWDQRINVLSFSQAAGGLNVTAPSSVNLCPPGHYLLWILNGSGVPSIARVVRISDFGSPPAAPTGLTAAGGIGKVNLSWNASPTATSYNVKRSTTSGGPYSTIASGVTGTSYADTTVTGGTTYYYVVSGVNPQGESPNSNQASATPVAPGTGSGLNGDYYDNMDFTVLRVTRTDPTVNFDWGTGSPDPSIGVDTFSARWTGQVETPFSQNYTFYTVSDDGVRLWVNGQLVIDNWTDHAPTENSGNISLTGGQRYNIQMDFYENGGGAVATLSWSSPSIAKEIIPQSQLYPSAPATPPVAPSGLAATAVSSSQINLSWTDNANNENGFTIERSTDGVNFTAIATNAPNVTSYNNTGLAAGATYHYRVRAFNSAGASAYSNVATATTPNSTTVTFTSIAAEDGYVTESSETSNVGGTVSSTGSNASSLRAGDNNQDRQIKTFLSFDTSSIPDGATILSATLKLKRGTVSGTNPFTTHGTCHADIKGGTGFGGAATLAAGDFQAAADATQVTSLSNAPANGNLSTGSLNSSGLSFINKTGRTQFRVYFSLDDNDDAGTDYIGWYSGNNGTASNRPVLEVVYQ